MRETVGSLRAYFIVVGVIGLAAAGLSARFFIALVQFVASMPPYTSITLIVTIVVETVLAIAFLYAGARLPVMLKSSTTFVVRLIYVTAAWTLVSYLSSLAAGFQIWALAHLVIGLLICWYLLRSVRRLASPAE
jgi:hypothetical protein